MINRKRRLATLPTTVPLYLGANTADPAVDVADEVLGRLASLDLYRALRSSEVTAVERNVIILRYGLDGQPPLSLAATGERVGLSARGTLGVERRALTRLRKVLGAGVEA